MWKTLNYEVIGKSHIKANKVCQDKTFTYNQNGVIAVALADGAGSCAHSEIGAIIACKTICRYFGENFDDLISISDADVVISRIIDVVNDELQKKADEMNVEKDTLSSTLLCVAMKNDDVVVFHVGDGLIAGVKNGELKALTMPENGEFANATYFVTSPRANDKANLLKGHVQGFDGFALMSDGSTASLYNKKLQRPANAIAKLIIGLQYTHSSYFMEYVKDVMDKQIHERTTDDCSICLLVNNAVNDVTFNQLNRNQRCSLFDLKQNASDKILFERFEILKFTSSPKKLQDIAQFLGLGKRKTLYRIKKLEDLGMIIKVKDQYISSIE